MAASYERVNYAIRPAKNIERKMLAEAFRRLYSFGRLDSYRYVGFGSTYFSDFSLFHKTLGITNAISIERDEANRERFLFNKPFRCIEIIFGESTDVLPTLPWDVRTIVWLDYDCKLTSEVLADVKYVSASAISGSVLVVTVNAQPDGLHEDRVQKVRDRVGHDKVPTDIDHRHLGGWGLAHASRRIVDNEILETLNQRNAVGGAEVKYRQLFNFQYRDDARMITVGGIFYDEGQSNLLAQCEFERLLFIAEDAGAYNIEVPNLTLKEMRYLDSHLPADPAAIEAPSIPAGDVRRYAKVYRYFPAFVDAEL